MTRTPQADFPTYKENVYYYTYGYRHDRPHTDIWKAGTPPPVTGAVRSYSLDQEGKMAKRDLAEMGSQSNHRPHLRRVPGTSEFPSDRAFVACCVASDSKMMNVGKIDVVYVDADE